MVAALEDLKHEHRLIERMLAVLEEVTRRFGQGEDVELAHVEQAISFVRGFADGCHHAKEEQGLFPVLAAKSPMIEAGPVKVLSADHEAGRKLMLDLQRGLEAIRSGRAEGRELARKALATYTHMLRRHIAKEEEILFPLSDGLLTDHDAEQLEAHFGRVEEESGEGAHERYEALVEQLEAALDLQPQGAHHT